MRKIECGSGKDFPPFFAFQTGKKRENILGRKSEAKEVVRK